MGAGQVPFDPAVMPRTTRWAYADDFAELRPGVSEATLSSVSSDESSEQDGPVNGTLCVLPTHGALGMLRIATWAAQTLRHHVALVSPPLGYVALEQLAKLFPTTVATLTDGPAFSVLEKRAALLTAALSFPELLQVRDAGRHTAI